MVTPEEVAKVDVFASLSRPLQEQLARVAADVPLSPGDYAIHEGDERALFAVLEGIVEPVKLTDGVPRVIGRREPGQLLGEIALVFGTVSPVGFRAATRARVMRLEASDYHAIAAAAPGLAAEIGRLASYRVGGDRGLQALIANPPPPRAILLGHRQDVRCTELRRFLERNQVTFRWITPDAPEAPDVWGGTLPSDDDYPAIRVIGGETAIRPEARQVAELLDLETEPSEPDYDTVIIGAGPAGLAAAVYGASEGLRTLVVEREAPGGQAGTSSRIENYLGFPSGVSGDELAMRALQQARRLGAEILVTRAVSRVDAASREVHLDGGSVIRARTLIIASGVSWRRLPIDGMDRLTGQGIFYGASRGEAANVHGLDVHIVGAGKSGGQAALFFATHARSVTILCRGPSLERTMSRYLVNQLAERPNIEVLLRTEVTGVHGDGALEALDVHDLITDETTRLESGGLFLFIGASPETEWLPTEIARDDRGFVLTGPEMRACRAWSLTRDPYLLETSVPGVFACGDVRFGPVKRVASAVGEGSMAIAFVHQYLAQPAEAPATASGIPTA